MLCLACKKSFPLIKFFKGENDRIVIDYNCKDCNSNQSVEMDKYLKEMEVNPANQKYCHHNKFKMTNLLKLIDEFEKEIKETQNLKYKFPRRINGNLDEEVIEVLNKYLLINTDLLEMINMMVYNIINSDFKNDPSVDLINYINAISIKKHEKITNYLDKKELLNHYSNNYLIDLDEKNMITKYNCNEDQDTNKKKYTNNVNKDNETEKDKEKQLYMTKKKHNNSDKKISKKNYKEMNEEKNKDENKHKSEDENKDKSKDETKEKNKDENQDENEDEDEDEKENEDENKDVNKAANKDKNKIHNKNNNKKQNNKINIQNVSWSLILKLFLMLKSNTTKSKTNIILNKWYCRMKLLRLKERRKSLRYCFIHSKLFIINKAFYLWEIKTVNRKANDFWSDKDIMTTQHTLINPRSKLNHNKSVYIIIAKLTQLFFNEFDIL